MDLKDGFTSKVGCPACHSNNLKMVVTSTDIDSYHIANQKGLRQAVVNDEGEAKAAMFFQRLNPSKYLTLYFMCQNKKCGDSFMAHIESNENTDGSEEIHFIIKS